MTNLIASLSLQVLFCHIISSRGQYSNDTNIGLQAATVPDGYIAYPKIGAAYKIYFERVSWAEARERCNLESARLAIVDSQRKLECVKNATYRTYNHAGYDFLVRMHIGIHRIDDKWVGVDTGLTLSNLPWIAGYPHILHDNCVVAQVTMSPFRSGIWNLHKCSFIFFYICEVPIPASYEVENFQTAQISFN